MQDKVVWVTGAGSGIGRATALAFAEAGARVALTGRRREPLEETAAEIAAAGSGESFIAPADIAAPGALEAAHRSVVEHWGAVEVLVNNAGWNIGRRHWGVVQASDAAQVIDLLLTAPFAASLLVLAAMREAGGGTIVQIASLAGVMTHPVSGPAYAAAKTGMIAMSDSLNAEQGIHGIRSICICPGEVETPILDTRPRPPSPADRALMLQPRDVANTVVFCASLPPRAAVTRLVIQPTDDNFFRETALKISAM